MTMTVGSEEQRTSIDQRPYLVVSTDSHASPSLEKQLRQYCPSQYLEAFDEFVQNFRTAQVQTAAGAQGVASPATPPAVAGSAALRLSSAEIGSIAAHGKQAEDDSLLCGGLTDPHDRLRDMDLDGVAADVIFSGAPNGEVLPFLALGFDQGPASMPVELRRVGSHIWNAWLADFVSVAPERHVGVMQVAIADVKGAVREIE